MTGVDLSARPAHQLDGAGGPHAEPGAVAAPRSRPARLADMLEAEPQTQVAAADLAAIVDDVTGALQGLAAELPPQEALTLDTFAVVQAHRHPERVGGSGDAFTASPRTCRRAVGLLAVSRCVRGFAPGPSAAVDVVLAAALEEDGGDVVSPSLWWASWYRTLPAGGRAVVAAEAVTWATQMLTTLDWRRLQRPPVIGGRDDWWQCPGPRRVTLRGRADGRVVVGRRLALLVVGSGSCADDWRVGLGFPALVSALGKAAPAAPCRVVGTWPQSGQVRVLNVDGDALRAGAAAVVSAAGTYVDARLEAAGRTGR
jgi:hypothetical protein